MPVTESGVQQTIRMLQRIYDQASPEDDFPGHGGSASGGGWLTRARGFWRTLPALVSAQGDLDRLVPLIHPALWRPRQN